MTKFTFYLTYGKGRAVSGVDEYSDREAAIATASETVHDGREVAVGEGEGDDVEWLGVWRWSRGLAVWQAAKCPRRCHDGNEGLPNLTEVTDRPGLSGWRRECGTARSAPRQLCMAEGGRLPVTDTNCTPR
jgi:hypothetical protein